MGKWRQNMINMDFFDVFRGISFLNKPRFPILASKLWCVGRLLIWSWGFPEAVSNLHSQMTTSTKKFFMEHLSKNWLMAIWICSIKKMTILMEHLSDLSIQKVSDSQIASVAGEFCWGTFTHITERTWQDGASVQPQVLPPSRRRSSGPAKKPLVHGEFEDYMDYTGKQRFVLLTNNNPPVTNLF